MQGGQDFHNRLSAGIFWEVRFANPHNQTAFIKVSGLRNPIIWGKGDTINSPIDLTSRNYKWQSIPTYPCINEDDILHTPDADIQTSKLGKHLTVQEAEVLLSYFTVPYMRIPLVVGWLASGDRVTLLFQKYMQGLLKAVLFEQGPWIREDEVA